MGNFKAVNKLMFFPEMDRDQNMEIMKKIHAEFGRPECVYSNTRLPENFELENKPKIELSEMERNLKGYSMVNTPTIKPGKKGNDDNDNNDNVEHIGTPFMR